MNPNPLYRLCILSTLETDEDREKYLKQHPIFQEHTGHWGISVVKNNGVRGLVITEGDLPLLTTTGNAFGCATGLINKHFRNDFKKIHIAIDAVTSRVIQAKNAVANTKFGKSVTSHVTEATNAVANTKLGKTVGHWWEVYGEIHLHMGGATKDRYYMVFSRDSTKFHSGFTQENFPDLISPYDINLSFREDLLTKEQIAMALFPSQRLLHLAGRINLMGEETLKYVHLAEKGNRIHNKLEYGKNFSQAIKNQSDLEDNPHSEPRGHSERVPHDTKDANLKNEAPHSLNDKHFDRINNQDKHIEKTSDKKFSNNLDHLLPLQIEELLKTEEVEFKNISIVISEKENHFKDLEKAWVEQTAKGIPEHILNFVNTVALGIYTEQKNLMEAKQKRQEFSNIQYQHATTVRQSKIPPQESLNFPFIQNRIFQSVIPSSIKHRLEEVQAFATEYREMQEQLAHMLDERKHLIAQTDSVEQKLNEYDQQIQRHYQESLNKKSKIIHSLQALSTAMNLTVGLIAGIPFGGVAGAVSTGINLTDLVGPASIGMEILTNYFRNQESEEMSTLQKMLRESAELHVNLATMRNANLQEMAQIRQSIENGRRMLLTAVKNNAITPKEGRDLLQQECGLLEQEISNIKQGIQRSYGEKTQAEVLKSIIQQRLATYLYSSHDSHRIKDKNRRQEEINIISLDSQAIQLTKVILSQTEELAQKEKLLKQYQESLNIQLPLTAIKDFLFDQLVKEIGNQNKDLETVHWQETVKEHLDQINSIRNARMQTINFGFAAIEQLFTEISRISSGKMANYSHKARTMTSLLNQGYNIRELYKTFMQGQEVLTLTYNSLAAGGTIFDAIVKMGLMAFLTNCVIPGIQLGTGILFFLRCTKQLVSSPREEITIGQLGNFLEHIANHFSSQINLLAKGITEQHLELKKILKTILPVTREFYEDTIKEIHTSRQVLLKEIRHSTYVSKTSEIYAFGENMIETCKKSLKMISGFEKKEKKENAFNKLIADLESWLRLTNSNTFSGVVPVRKSSSACSLKIEVSLEEMKYNPEIYTRALGIKIQKTSNIPSLHLLKCLHACYSEICSYESFDENQIAQLISFGNDLKEHVDLVFNFCGSFTSFAMKVRKKQQAVFLRWKQTIEKVETFGKELENALIKQYLSAYTFNENFVGSSKFQVGLELTQKFFKPETRKATTIATTTAVATAGSGVVLTVAAGAAKVGAVLLIPGIGIPLAGVVTISEIAIIGAAAGIGKSVIDDQQKFAELIDMHSIVGLKGRFKEKNVKWLVNSKKTSVTEVWLSKKGELNAIFYKPRSIRTIASVGKKTKSKEYPFHAKFLMSKDNDPTITVSPDSQITINELQHIQDHFPALDNKIYDRQASELKSLYESWLKKEPIDEENPFQALAASSLLICPKTPSLVPLLFPQELIEACAPIEKKLLALKHEAPLIPTYSFEYNEKEQKYELNINLNGIVNGQNIPLMTLEIAEFDKVTVESFKTVSFEESSEVNINEFLIQAMYTRVCLNTRSEKCLIGLPGSSTTSLNNGKWDLPIDLSFPGLHALLKNAPHEKFCYNHKRFTEEASVALMTFANTEEFSAELLSFFTPRNPRLLPNALEFHHDLRKLSPSIIEEIKPLIKSYQLLTAFFCLASSADDRTMEATLESWLGILPVESNQALIERFAVDILSKEPTKDSISHFRSLLDKSNSYDKFISNLG